MKQHEAVIEVMRAHGGYATLGQLYQEALKVPGADWTKTKTPFASIRRIVQTHNEFFRLRPGLWALEEYRNRIPENLFSEPDSAKPQEAEFNHTYYQGLLVEIGNFKKRHTFIPAQDKNRKFLNSVLSDIATLKEIFPFGSESAINRARTIDVLWFNERKMPEAAYEVEHSTDMQNSLLKFVDLQDFKIDFRIVAPVAKKAQFENKLSLDAFRPIRSLVNFISYDEVAEWHSRAARLVAMENSLGL